MTKDKTGLILEQILLFGKWFDKSRDVAYDELEIAITTNDDDVYKIKRAVVDSYDEISEVFSVVMQNILKIEKG